eukprot:9339011-Pyramimonas_sp.AAC.1
MGRSPFGLLLNMAMHGLVDGPILFHVALLRFWLGELKFYQSVHGDNFIYVSDAQNNELSCIISLAGC